MLTGTRHMWFKNCTYLFYTSFSRFDPRFSELRPRHASPSSPGFYQALRLRTLWRCCPSLGINPSPTVQEAAAGVNDVRDIAFALVIVGHNERMAQATDDFGRAITFAPERANAILPH